MRDAQYRTVDQPPEQAVQPPLRRAVAAPPCVAVRSLPCGGTGEAGGGQHGGPWPRRRWWPCSACRRGQGPPCCPPPASPVPPHGRDRTATHGGATTAQRPDWTAVTRLIDRSVVCVSHEHCEYLDDTGAPRPVDRARRALGLPPAPRRPARRRGVPGGRCSTPAPAASPGGFIGVDVFFVLSGFLVTRLLAPRPRRPAAASASRRFYARRVRRLLPAASSSSRHRRGLLGRSRRRPSVDGATASIAGRGPLRRELVLHRRVDRLLRGRHRRPARCCTTGRCRSRSSSTCCGRWCSPAARALAGARPPPRRRAAGGRGLPAWRRSVAAPGSSPAPTSTGPTTAPTPGPTSSSPAALLALAPAFVAPGRRSAVVGARAWPRSPSRGRPGARPTSLLDVGPIDAGRGDRGDRRADRRARGARGGPVPRAPLAARRLPRAGSPTARTSGTGRWWSSLCREAALGPHVLFAVASSSRRGSPRQLSADRAPDPRVAPLDRPGSSGGGRTGRQRARRASSRPDPRERRDETVGTSLTAREGTSARWICVPGALARRPLPATAWQALVLRVTVSGTVAPA